MSKKLLSEFLGTFSLLFLGAGAIVSANWNNFWLYILAPICGAVIAAAVYQSVAKPE